MNEARLRKLYNNTSKHSEYQILAPAIMQLLPELQVCQGIARYEMERFSAIKKVISFKEQRILDIGGNTGYFSFELVANGAAHVTFVEGNHTHWEFVNEAVQVTGFSERITCKNQYFQFNENLDSSFDTIFLLNVLHHVGDDFGNAGDIHLARDAMGSALKRLASYTRFLVLQIGFNWMGNINYPLFQNGTKEEMVNWIGEVIQNEWQLSNVLVAESGATGLISYNPMGRHNRMRKDELGEFLNRPIFILESKTSFSDSRV